MIFHWIEIQKFLRKNIIKIIIGTLLLTVLFVIFTNRPETIPEIEDPSIETTENSEVIPPYTEAEPAAFYFYAENDDGTSFTNHLLIEQYLLSTDVLRNASDDSEIDLIKLIEETGNIMRVNYRESGETKIVGVAKNEQTNLIEVFSNVGDSSKNLQITQYFFEYIKNGNVPFLANKNVYIFKEPRILPINNTYDILVSEPQTPVEKNIFSDIAIGLVLGLFFTVFTLWLTSLFSQKLIYSFSYVIKENDRFLLVDKRRDNILELTQLLSKNGSSDIIVIRENIKANINSEVTELLTQFKSDNKIIEVESFLDIQDTSELNRLVYIIEEGNTTREWYQLQRRLDEYSSVPTFIVHVNKF